MSYLWCLSSRNESQGGWVIHSSESPQTDCNWYCDEGWTQYNYSRSVYSWRSRRCLQWPWSQSFGHCFFSRTEWLERLLCLDHHISSLSPRLHLQRQTEMIVRKITTGNKKNSIVPRSSCMLSSRTISYGNIQNKQALLFILVQTEIHIGAPSVPSAVFVVTLILYGLPGTRSLILE